jgi:hypothetical protein
MVFCQMAEYYLVGCRSVECYLVDVSFGQVSFGQTLFGQMLFGQTLLFFGGIWWDLVCTKNIQFSPVKIQLRPPAVSSSFFHNNFSNYVTNFGSELKTTFPPHFNSVQFQPSTTPFHTR